ncbi:hypothetical protein N657DRAFT_647775 [Parathielavia appendiculata]|uniref:Uncharacterized protein n=1 Tax=Parathielavia appendiculata TaxID=2587402 RepID=A0AAN6TVS0_9PEZI|nr:hypothetical protein N657DRAFT_647775 [Parathielavia appendiculata]
MELQLWIDHPAFPMPGHKFTGYYFTYPSEAQQLGLVSTIADDPPMLNWIFVDKDSGMVRHGGRQATLGGHMVGPWYWTDDEQWLTLEKDPSRFVAVQMENKKWAIAWDLDGNCSSKGGGSGGDVEASGTDCETETGNQQQTAGENGQKTTPRRPRKWVPIMLHRKMQLGMESRYVKGANG